MDETDEFWGITHHIQDEFKVHINDLKEIDKKNKPLLNNAALRANYKYKWN